MQTLPSSTQACSLALRLRGPALPPYRLIVEQKTEPGSGRMKATATTTHRMKGCFWGKKVEGGGQTCRMCSRQRRETLSFAHLEPEKLEKGGRWRGL